MLRDIHQRLQLKSSLVYCFLFCFDDSYVELVSCGLRRKNGVDLLDLCDKELMQILVVFRIYSAVSMGYTTIYSYSLLARERVKFALWSCYTDKRLTAHAAIGFYEGLPCVYMYTFCMYHQHIAHTILLLK